MAQLQPGDPGFDWSRYAEFRKGNDPLAEAQAFLADPSRSQLPQPSDQDIAEATQSTTTARAPMSLRGLTDIGEKAALPLGLMGMVPTPASPFLLGASTLLGGAGALRKTLNPDADESRTEGAIQLGLSALPQAGRLVRGARNLMRPMVQLPGIPQSVEKAYRGAQSLERFGGLNEAPISLKALEESIRPAAAKIPGLPASWQQFVKPEGFVPQLEKKAAKVVPTKAGYQSRIARMNQQSEAGYRNVPSHNPAYDDMPTGDLASITPAEWSKLGPPQPPTFSKPLEPGGWGEDLLAELSANERRRSIPARARAFRNNTPLE